MKLNQWTVGLAAAGVVSLGSVVSAEEAQQHQVLTALSATTLSGYVDTSIMWKPGTGNGFIPGRAFDGGMGNPGGNKLDGFNLNVMKLKLDKPLEEGNWSAGYTVGLIFGPDAVAYNTSANAFGSDFSLKDAYVTLRAPVGKGLDIKLGTFSTIVGYEVFEGPDNPNYSRSFGWQLEPTQHTGVLGTYHFTDALSLTAGVANTWNAGINARPTRGGVPAAESEKTYMGALTFTVPDDQAGVLGGSSFYLAVIDGLAGNTRDTTTYYAGATLKTPLKNLLVGAAFDYREDGPIGVTVGHNWAWAAAGYASLSATDKLKFNGRVDYTRGSDGTWFASPGGRQNELGSLTGTVDYSLWENVLTRLEARWDHAFRDQPYGGTYFFPNNDRNALTLALNVVYKF
jgi:hypothetical protein